MKNYWKKGISMFLVIVMMVSLFAGLPPAAYAASTWQTVGSAGFSAGTAQFTALLIDSSDTPYVAYGDQANSNKAAVMKLYSPPTYAVTYNGNTGESIYEVMI